MKEVFVVQSFLSSGNRELDHIRLPLLIKKLIMARDITITDGGNGRLKFEHTNPNTPDWFVSIVDCNITGVAEGGAVAAAAANRRARGGMVVITAKDGRTDRIFLNRVDDTAGLFSVWTAGDDKAAVDAAIAIIEAVA